MKEDSKNIRILAVDDHPILRQGIAGLIADESDNISHAKARQESPKNGGSALRLA